MKIELHSVNTNKLHDELIKANIIPELVESLENTTWITISDDEEPAVMEIVEKHDPAPLPIPKSEEEKLKEQLELEKQNSAEVSNTLMEFMNFYFEMNPEQA